MPTMPLPLQVVFLLDISIAPGPTPTLSPSFTKEESMQVSELDHAKLQLENDRLKLNLVESQMQLLQAQHILVKQDIEKHENELSILQSKESVEQLD
jgi:hypothetical protein